MSSLYGSAVTNETLGGNVAMVTWEKGEAVFETSKFYPKVNLYMYIFLISTNPSS